MSKFVEVHPAFRWDCPSCGHKNNLRTSYNEQQSTKLSKKNNAHSIVMSIDSSAKCRECQSEFNVNVEESDNPGEESDNIISPQNLEICCMWDCDECGKENFSDLSDASERALSFLDEMNINYDEIMDYKTMPMYMSCQYCNTKFQALPVGMDESKLPVPKPWNTVYDSAELEQQAWLDTKPNDFYFCICNESDGEQVFITPCDFFDQHGHLYDHNLNIDHLLPESIYDSCESEYSIRENYTPDQIREDLLKRGFVEKTDMMDNFI